MKTVKAWRRWQNERLNNNTVTKRKFSMSEMTLYELTTRSYPPRKKQTSHHSQRSMITPSRRITLMLTLLIISFRLPLTLTIAHVCLEWNSEFACMIPGLIGGLHFFSNETFLFLSFHGNTSFFYIYDITFLSLVVLVALLAWNTFTIFLLS
jgi:hypothetical protein